MSPRYAARVDTNQADIVAQLRACGLSVCHLHTIGHGVPDLLVGGMDVTHNRARLANLLVELKSDGGTLTPDEEQFCETWNGLPVLVAHSAEDVLAWFGIEVE